MATVKKIDPSWRPSENKDLKVGETIEITDYTRLVRSGAAILVDESGNELPLPGQVFNCPICYKGTSTLSDFVLHVDTHKKVDSTLLAPVKAEEVVIEREVETQPEEKVEETKIEEAPADAVTPVSAEEAPKAKK